MRKQPLLRTARLRLRPFTAADAPRVRELAGARELAEMTLLIPHPYPAKAARQWISERQQEWAEGTGVAFAIVPHRQRRLCGAISLTFTREHARAELGYWIGMPYWGQGYCTEAAQAVLRFGFDSLQLHRIYAHHFGRNPASGRVLQKIGMRYEGCLREHVSRWGRYEDLETYGVLRPEWESAHST